MTVTNARKIRAGYQPIPGYTLEEMIGRGGFGEVWRADAPGGLKKAVKFVYGSQDQSRASRELRSLERIRGVHHPFLLTLERFEIVNDQLVIVTELAEGSLEDVFTRHCDRGSCGIPRDALLGHMHDAADALDYLHQSYQLQHLDIKPGNLLIVGGHVKVADFGLLKDLTEAECSIVGGLTPIYAPPEVFDGRPSLHSDQYSLAVMYQELLTGTRPFSGRTIAQLATQHVHSAPNLDPLPPGDRPVAARALEKDPSRRFPNCKEFIEALRTPRGQRIQVTVSGGKEENPDQASGDVADLPQISAEAASTTHVTNHALVIGLGGSGAECLRELRSRVADFHSASPVELSCALIDTDLATIHSMRVAEASDRIPPCKTIHIPLKTAHEYRSGGTAQLKTISRRWIYNVPRSRSTEGMRPLGRLALVDHGTQVKEALAEAIQHLIEGAGGQTPRIYVVGSLAGGTGSGVYLDVVHLLRHLLDRVGQEDAQILSLLTTKELRADPASPLAMHDTHAAMIEMRHFMQPGNGYPGDEGAGFPSVPAARTPLHDAYLVATAPRGTMAPPPIQTVTDYVWTDVTGGGDLLSAARAVDSQPEQPALAKNQLRSVGVVTLGASRRLENKVLVPATVRSMLLRWLGLPSKARKEAIPFSDRIMRRCAISHVTFLDATTDLAGNDDQERTQRVAQLLDELSATQRQSEAKSCERIEEDLRQRSHSSGKDLLIESMMSNLKREFSVALHDRRVDLTTVIETIRLMIQSTEPTTQGEDEIESDAEQGTITPPDTIELQRELQLLSTSVRNIAAIRTDQLRGRLKELMDGLEDFATTLAMAVVQISRDYSTESNPWDDMPEEIREHFDSTMVSLHELVASKWLLRPLSEQNAMVADVDQMVTQLSEEALPVVAAIVDQQSRSVQEPDTVRPLDVTATLQMSFDSGAPHDSALGTKTLVADALGHSDSKEPLSVDKAIDAVCPTLLSCGGSQRLVLVVGKKSEQEQFEPQVRALHSGALTTALIPGATPKLVHEAQGIEMKKVLSLLSTLNGGNSQVTSRLVTRTDVRWEDC